MVASGTFTIQSTPGAPWSAEDGVILAPMTFAKRFAGDLDATSEVHMLAARTPVPGSAGYVAIERVVGALAGRSGSFVLQHTGTLDRGASTLSVTVVPDSGTGGLAGLSGRMDIVVASGEHSYTFDYTLPA